MIRNEFAIITRCLDSFISLVDGIFILDTGSTDETITFLQECNGEYKGKPLKYESRNFTTFGESRTLSYDLAELAFPSSKFGLFVDADFTLHPDLKYIPDNIDTAIGIQLYQRRSGQCYPNLRILCLNHPSGYRWKCIGSTHEVWRPIMPPQCKTSSGTILIVPRSEFLILDLDDGRFKEDKSERDMKLLKKDLLQDPNCGRTLSLLGGTCRDLKRLPEAIIWLERAAAQPTPSYSLAGLPWVDEDTFYVRFQIAVCLARSGRVLDALREAALSYSLRPHRIEPMVLALKLLQNMDAHALVIPLAMSIFETPFPSSDFIFPEEDCFSPDGYLVPFILCVSHDRLGNISDAEYYRQITLQRCDTAFVVGKTVEDGVIRVLKTPGQQCHWTL
jgi:tetratricopeptide (TPR) repeat protein